MRKTFGKYGVAAKDKRTLPDGTVFDSKGEMERFLFLRQRQQDGHICGEILRQVSYRIEVNGRMVCKYIADFVYHLSDGTEVIEDFKGVMTPVANLKKKLFFAVYNKEITIVRKPKEWCN